jgi:hypothetical protein
MPLLFSFSMSILHGDVVSSHSDTLSTDQRSAAINLLLEEHVHVKEQITAIFVKFDLLPFRCFRPARRLP